MTRKSMGLGAGMTLLAALFGGCNQTPRVARQALALYSQERYAEAAAVLKPEIEDQRTKRDINYVLNNLRYGSCTIAAGQFDAAKHAFYDAYQVINSGETNDAGRQLQATVVFEGVKVWKGEPYERAMADYYQGVLYLMDHNYGNARAAFQESLFSLRENASKDDLDHYKLVESQFALGYFGLGFCNLRMNRSDLAATNFALAQKYDPRLAGLIAEVQRPGVNALIFVDAGEGPQKDAKGWYNEESVFGPTPQEAGPIPAPVALLDGRPVTRQNINYSTVDTLAMAQDRRWMDIDTVKKVKAVIGTGMIAGGTAVAAHGAANDNKKETAIGAGVALAGILLAASSQSDTRYWELLPRTVYVIPLTLSAGQHEVVVQAGGARSAPVQMVYTPPRAGAGPQDAIFYFRLQRSGR
jgi:tetratricopeptide (TPR) repeat protein